MQPGPTWILQKPQNYCNFEFDLNSNELNVFLDNKEDLDRLQ